MSLDCPATDWGVRKKRVLQNQNEVIHMKLLHIITIGMFLSMLAVGLAQAVMITGEATGIGLYPFLRR